MIALVVLLVAIVAAVVAVGLWLALRRGPAGGRDTHETIPPGAPAVEPEAPPRASTSEASSPEARDGALSVDGDVVEVTFDVVAGPHDEHLVEVLTRAAREQLDAAAHSDPGAAAAKWLRVSARDHRGEPRVLATVALTPTASTEVREIGGTRRLAPGATSGEVPELADTIPTRALREELPITAALADFLDRAGAPADAGFLAFGPALLQATGYALTDGPYPGTFLAERDGQRVYTHVEPAGGRELPEAFFDRFFSDATSSGVESAMLLTDGFVPVHVRMRRRRPGVKLVDRSGLADVVHEASHRLAGL